MGASHVVSISPGSSLQTAFNALKPGDILELQPGTYAAPNYPGIEKSGTASAWIIVRGAAGSKPTIDLQNSGELHVGGSYLRIENLEVIHGAGNNIHVTPPNSTTPQTNVVFENVTSRAMSSGTGAAVKAAGLWNNGAGAKLDGLYFEGCDLSGSLSNAVLDAVAIRHAVVRDCYLHDPVNGSLTCPGLFFKGGSSDLLVERTLIRGIRGNTAIMVGGDTGAQWFDGLYSNPKIEGVNQVIRNNILADFDDSAFDIRGCKTARIYNNTIVTQTSFSIFRITWGGSGSGTQIGNYDIQMTDNLVLCSGSPTFAQNNGNAGATLTFGRNFWGGSLKNVGGPGIPSFPQQGDLVIGSGSFGAVVVNPSSSGITGLADALRRFVLAAASPAKSAGTPNTIAPEDIEGTTRSATAPSLGAFE